ncbi:oxygen-insensitive NAD(P)H nitroreductase [Aureibacter tunicatorum]|uniref:Nitroreductase/dihydropteridine reductase n=1 Tax=Aureibacter tunicatorum TaxID=866807 RepID=A0AAE3XRV6_9BACT|nr:oxygen-insensitive NAD(P)H nitroreductase [Aureibacter tunicatorum]MDR6240810.1 nitroreductase/dihydropteridine reductase [Aureibacter tunicatorum]BDD06857.1 oxygen-insensitive NAD(P)H-dependent nitroreductase NfsB [Aureibacter tunicatorum]
MDIIEKLHWRYSTKEFDRSKRISEEKMLQVKELLRLSPSSVNLQPWHFIIAETDQGKTRMAKGTEGFFSFNASKVLNASHVVLFCSKTVVDEEYMQTLLEQEDKDGRYPDEEIKGMVYGARNIFTDKHRYDLKDLQHWMEKQVYLNVGNFLLGLAAMEVDALPMEGIDLKALDEEFDLRAKGFTSVAMVAIGYRTESDFNASTPKSRLPFDKLITEL